MNRYWVHELKYTNKYNNRKHHKSGQRSYVKTDNTQNSNVTNPVATIPRTESMRVDSHML